MRLNTNREQVFHLNTDTSEITSETFPEAITGLALRRGGGVGRSLFLIDESVVLTAIARMHDGVRLRCHRAWCLEALCSANPTGG